VRATAGLAAAGSFAGDGAEGVSRGGFTPASLTSGTTGGILSDASGSGSTDAGGGAENLTATSETSRTGARATVAMMIRFCAMVTARANCGTCAGLNS